MRWTCAHPPPLAQDDDRRVFFCFFSFTNDGGSAILFLKQTHEAGFTTRFRLPIERTADNQRGTARPIFHARSDVARKRAWQERPSRTTLFSLFAAAESCEEDQSLQLSFFAATVNRWQHSLLLHRHAQGHIMWFFTRMNVYPLHLDREAFQQ